MIFKKRKIAEVARCYRACFLDENGMITQEGAMVLRDLFSFAGLDDTPFDADAIVMARNCGRSDTVNRLRGFVFTNPDLYEQINQLEIMDEVGV